MLPLIYSGTGPPSGRGRAIIGSPLAWVCSKPSPIFFLQRKSPFLLAVPARGPRGTAATSVSTLLASNPSWIKPSCLMLTDPHLSAKGDSAGMQGFLFNIGNLMFVFLSTKIGVLQHVSTPPSFLESALLELHFCVPLSTVILTAVYYLDLDNVPVFLYLPCF